MLLRLGDVFSRLTADEACSGCVYFRESTNPTLATECLLVSDVDMDPEGDIPAEARIAGFLVEGLDTDDIRDCLLCSAQLEQPRSSSADLESFIYYWRFDAFLPYLGAPEPLPSNYDREFYDMLGEEDPANPCRYEGCSRGAVQYSVLCRVHHFESIRKRDCPFND